jgi:mannose-6-phosphate isomerase-like protein (cupin superfamily)
MAKEIRKFHVDPHAKATKTLQLETAVLKMGKAHFTDMIGIFEPEGMIGVEYFDVGETFQCAFFHSEAHYIFGGKAEITYTLGALHKEKKKMIAETGDVYLIPCGAHVQFKVISDEPYRHLCFIMPAQEAYKELFPPEP